MPKKATATAGVANRAPNTNVFRLLPTLISLSLSLITQWPFCFFIVSLFFVFQFIYLFFSSFFFVVVSLPEQLASSL